MAFNPYDANKEDRLEHDRMVMDLQAVMAHPSGKGLIKYLFKNFSVGEMPPPGMNAELLHDLMGFMRAGQSLFEICSQADPITTSQILAELQKEKYNVQKT